MGAHPGHDHSAKEMRGRALWISLGLIAGFMVAEIVGGLLFNSLALLADAAHMFSDVVGLGIALIALKLTSRPASARHTYGLQRAEVLGAQANAATLLVVAGWIIYQAVRRIGEPPEVEGGGLLVVAVLGLIVNVVCAVLLARARGESLNMRGAYLHMVADAAGSVGVISAAIAVIFFDANWFDPLISIAIAILVLWSTWGLLRDTTRVLMEGSPRGMDPQEVEDAIAADEAVEAVHHLHVWNLASDVSALSAHVILEGEWDLHGAQAEGDRLKTMLHDRFGIEHCTLELECHPCARDPHAVHGQASKGAGRTHDHAHAHAGDHGDAGGSHAHTHAH
jgi:cobalt-zinc-cadmium efflux system protein